MKNALTLTGSTAVSAFGAALGVLLRLPQVIFLTFVVACLCIRLGLSVMRDIRSYRAGR